MHVTQTDKIYYPPFPIFMVEAKAGKMLVGRDNSHNGEIVDQYPSLWASCRLYSPLSYREYILKVRVVEDCSRPLLPYQKNDC